VRRARSAEAVPFIAEALVAGGVTAIEITTSTPDFARAIRETRAALGTAAFVGAGTLLTESQAGAAVDAGAEFLVSPVLRPDLMPVAFAADFLAIALAELARRGLLLPARLPQVLPRIVSALHFDVPRGATSVGTHVRDAACYVCWAFARAFEPSVMQPHVEPLAKALLIVVVFDREVNCRRAAAAAFQENVGRQGNFPHGIDIVTKADYFSVGSRPNAYLTIGTYLGGFDAYRGPLLDHLATVKFKHWDPHIRLLAAQAAACLAPLDAPYVLDTLFPTLYDKTLSPDLKARHGATHMIAEALLGLARACDGGEGRLLPDATRKAVSGLVPAIEKARLYRGRGGEVMRGATARLLEVCALLRLPSGPKASKEKLVSLDDSIKHPHEPISHAAVAGLQAVAAAYFSAPAPGTSAKRNDGSEPKSRVPCPSQQVPML
jgi:hypothetical protein